MQAYSAFGENIPRFLVREFFDPVRAMALVLPADSVVTWPHPDLAQYGAALVMTRLSAFYLGRLRHLR